MMIFIFIIVIGFIATLNLILTLVGYLKREGNETPKLVRKRSLLTAKLILLLIFLIPFRRYLMNYETNRLEPVAEKIIVDMYSNSPDEVGEELEKYKDKFTKKGFTYIDGKDNTENIIKKYSKYSDPENTVLIQDASSTFDKVYVLYKIQDEAGETNSRLAIFTKANVDKFKEVEEFELKPILEGED